MATPGQILLIGGTAALAFLAMRKKKTATAVSPVCNTAPYPPWNRGMVVEAIDKLLDEGRREPGGIAQSVASNLFSPHPSGATVTFPPLVNAAAGLPLQGVQCVWDQTAALVLSRMQERGIEPGPDQDEDEPIIFDGNGDPYAPGYPWNKPILEKNNYPTPGMFWRAISSGQEGYLTGDQLAVAALGSALYMAGNQKPFDWIKGDSADAKRLRNQMAKLIRCSPWNDALYGQTDPNKAGGSDQVTYMMQPSGRGLNWLPYHADNIGRLAQGLPPKRTTTLQGAKLPGGGGNRQMQLWIPAVNLASLGPNVPDASLAVTTYGMQWPDGSSTLLPPTVIQARGIESNLSVAGGWGCKDVL